MRQKVMMARIRLSQLTQMRNHHQHLLRKHCGLRRSSGAVMDAADIVVTCGENDNKESESQPAVEININKSPMSSHRSSVPSVPSPT